MPQSMQVIQRLGSCLRIHTYTVAPLVSKPMATEFKGKSSIVNAAGKWRHYARWICRENLICEFEQGIHSEELLPERVCREFVGGYGLGIRVLYEKMKARVEPLGEENMLGIVTGVLTATSVPGSGRYGVVSSLL